MAHPAPVTTVAARVLSRFLQVWDLLFELLLRDLKIRYKRSYLGILWSLMTPITQVVIFSFLFIRVLPLEIAHYTTFVFSGVLAWSWFSSALYSAGGSVVGNSQLVRRPGFPVAVLPLLSVAGAGIHFLLAMPILLALMLIDGLVVGYVLLALPIVILIQFYFTLGWAFLIAASNVRFRDTQHLLGVGLMAMFYLTPVFYDSASLPDEYALIHAINPLAALFNAYRDIVIGNRWPDVHALGMVVLIGSVFLALGYWLFRRMSLRFAEEL